VDVSLQTPGEQVASRTPSRFCEAVCSRRSPLEDALRRLACGSALLANDNYCEHGERWVSNVIAGAPSDVPSGVLAPWCPRLIRAPALIPRSIWSRCLSARRSKACVASSITPSECSNLECIALWVDQIRHCQLPNIPKPLEGRIVHNLPLVGRIAMKPWTGHRTRCVGLSLARGMFWGTLEASPESQHWRDWRRFLMRQHCTIRYNYGHEFRRCQAIHELRGRLERNEIAILDAPGRGLPVIAVKDLHFWWFAETEKRA